MRIPQVKEFLKRLAFARVQGKPVSVCMFSAPGVGKSQIAEQVATEIGEATHTDFGMITKIGSSMAPEDFSGVPYVLDGDVRYARPFWVPPKDAPEFGALFIDEFTQLREDMQKPVAQLALEGCINDWKMPEGWCVWMAGNRIEDRAGVVKMLSHLPNRLAIITVDFHIDDYTAFLHRQQVHPLFIGLANHRPDLLTSFDPAQTINCTPRSFHRVAELYPLFENDPFLQREMFASMVGAGVAAEISGYLKVWQELPSFEDIVADPGKAKMPSDNPAALWGIVAMLAAKVTGDSWPSVARYINRIPEEMRTNAVLSCCLRNPKLRETAEFGMWVKDNAAILIRITQLANALR